MSETITDIVREMRKRGKAEYKRIVPDGYGDYMEQTVSNSFLCDYADRIEAAHRREEAERKKKDDEEFALAMDALENMDVVQSMKALCGIEDKPCGNAAKMREALEKIAHYDDNGVGMDDPYCADGHICADIAREALAAPPRNCDVGTAGEQTQRFIDFCTEHREHVCRNCPFRKSTSCELAWAQMPYEKGGAE